MCMLLHLRSSTALCEVSNDVSQLHETRSKILSPLCWRQYGVLSSVISMWLSNWLVVLAGHVVLSTVSVAGCLECQLLYSSSLVALSCETVPVETAYTGISLEIYCRIWEGRVRACICHKRALSSLIFMQLKETHDVKVVVCWCYSSYSM